MSESPDRADGQSSLKRALRALEEMKARLDELEGRRREPIAILGMACRMPGGADTPEKFWANLRDGVDSVTDVPRDRFDVDRYYDPRPGTPGKTVTRRGAFLESILDFDGVTGLAPKDLHARDPQFTLLDLVCFEALENAGLAPFGLDGSRTGVFVGIWGVDYWLRVAGRPPEGLEATVLAGNTHSMAAGHVSYLFGFRGPSLAIDTACSASLVSVDLACQSLRAGESDLALAGGVNLILGPESFVCLSAGRLLAPDGRCKAFSSAADGYGRGEGCGVVVLKRLSDARRDGDPVRAVILGCAVNQDGRTSGITVPNGPAQEEVARRALAAADLAPAAVDYVEAHGTGTALGDPIEVIALADVYGQGRSREDPLRVGSVKTNIGHLESAAGVAGLIKVVLALENELIPRSLHFESPNPEIPWERLLVSVVSEAVPWPRGRRPRYAGVSSFGASGTNAHVVVGEAPSVPRVQARHVARPSHVLALSARDEGALSRAARRLSAHLAASPGLDVGDVCYAANVGRSPFRERLAVVASSLGEVQEALDAFASGRPSGASGGRARGLAPPAIAFAFTGQGSQHPGMGRTLYRTQPAFRRAMDRCGEIVSPLLGVSLLEVIDPPEGSDPLLDDTTYTQPALFALEYALAEMWRSWAIQPAYVLGHSAGEYPAACVAGVFDLEDALTLIAARGRLMGALPRTGKMVAILAAPDRVAPAIAPFAAEVSVAALNGPENVVISGRAEAVDAAVRCLEGQGVETRALAVSHAFHSPLMEPIREEFEHVARAVRYREPRIPVVSNLTGAPAGPELAIPEYWVSHLVKPVRFAEGIGALHRLGCELFLEIGPRPVLSGMGEECLPSGAATFLPSLRPGQDDWRRVLTTLGELFVRGAPVDWKAFDEGYGRAKVALPTYPFEGKRPLIPAPSVEPAGQGEAGRKVVSDYYDAFRALTPDVAAGLEESVEDYLTFAPFAEVIPGFSWVRAWVDAKAHPEWARILLEGQRLLREAVFRKVDFAGVRKALDFGCGYASDLCTLALRHPHLEGDGYTLSAEQVKVGREKARRLSIQDRVRIHQRDSARDEFPGMYDLAFGLEVAHHVRDKRALFGHISGHLNERGLVCLADFVSRVGFPIEDDDISSYFPTTEEWVELFTASGLRATDCVDVSREMANFLTDPHFDDNVAELARRGNADAIRGLKSYDRLGRLHAEGRALYVLLTAEKRSDLPEHELRRDNQRVLEEPVPFAQVAIAHGCYELDWVRSDPRPAFGAGGRSRRWLVLSDGEGVGETLVGRLRAMGDRSVIVSRGDAYVRLGAESFALDAADPAGFPRLLSETAGGGPFAGVVHLWGLDAPDNAALSVASLRETQRRLCGSVIHLVKAAVTAEGSARPRILLVTEQAQPVAGGSVRVAQAPLLGLAKALWLEHPDLWAGAVDVPGGRVEEKVAAVLAELGEPDGETHVAYRGGQRLVQRLVRRPRPQPGRPRVRAEATYLVTGGTGGLGLAASRWLVDLGARHLLLTGRRGATEEARRQIRAMELQGVEVRVARADVADEHGMRALLAEATLSMPPLRGVLHAAGLAGGALLSEQSWDGFNEVLDVKVAGTFVVHEVTKDLALDFFVCYSSAAAVIGSHGQSAYVAANAFQDALSHHRVRSGLPGLAVNWGSWAEAGMAQALPEQTRRALRDRGMGEIAPADGVEMLGRLIAEGRPQAVVMPVCWPKFVKGVMAGQVPPYLQRVASPSTETPEAGAPAADVRGRIRAAPPADRAGILRQHLQERVATILGHASAAQVDRDLTLLELGFDSLTAVLLRNQIQTSLGIDLPIGRLLGSASVASLTQLLQERLAPPPSEQVEVI